MIESRILIFYHVFHVEVLIKLVLGLKFAPRNIIRPTYSIIPVVDGTPWGVIYCNNC